MLVSLFFVEAVALELNSSKQQTVALLRPCELASRSFVVCRIIIPNICLPPSVLQMSFIIKNLIFVDWQKSITFAAFISAMIACS